jgi:hypothetical protein
MEISRQQSQSYQDKIIKELEAAPDKPLRMFSGFEDEMIKKYYPVKGGEILAKVFKKTKKQIETRANYLGLKRI